MLRHKYRGRRFDLVVGQDPARHDHVVDERIIPRFVRYERRDLCIGIALVTYEAERWPEIAFADIKDYQKEPA